MIWSHFNFSDGDEETPSIDHYDLIDCSTGRKIGVVDMGIDGATPNQYNLMNIPYFQSIWAYYGGLRYDFLDDCWWPPSNYAQYKIFEAKPVYTTQKEKLADQCPKCKIPGTFIRTALVCPKCHKTLGGF